MLFLADNVVKHHRKSFEFLILRHAAQCFHGEFGELRADEGSRRRTLGGEYPYFLRSSLRYGVGGVLVLDKIGVNVKSFERASYLRRKAQTGERVVLVEFTFVSGNFLQFLRYLYAQIVVIFFALKQRRKIPFSVFRYVFALQRHIISLPKNGASRNYGIIKIYSKY